MSIATTGATLTSLNQYNFYTFKSGINNTITFPSNTTAQVLIVGGGGGGGISKNTEPGGGGGAGGVGVGTLQFSPNTSYTIAIGNGGTGGTSVSSVITVSSTIGQNTTITGIGISETAKGGGYGANGTNQNGGDGGSGGGGCGVSYNNHDMPGGIATNGNGILTYYGNNGGSGKWRNVNGGGGGGGATSVGGNGTDSTSGNGGSGYTWINGSVYGGGGGGGTSGIGGTGGGGNGGGSGGVSGTVNTGGGGGGCKSTDGTGGGGGSGIVIIVVLNTTITNGSFNFNSTAITANSLLYVGTAGTGQDSRLTTAGNQTFANIDLYFPCWSFFTRDANNNAIILTNGNSAIRVTENDNNVQALNVQQYQNALLIASQSIQLSVGTYVLTYRAGPRYDYYFSTQKLSTSISSSQYGTIVLKNSESFVAGWTSFTHTIFIYTPGSYSINFTYENGSGSGTAIGTGTADGTSIALTDVNLTMTNQVPCFLQGSKILTFNPTTNFEEYVPIETLRKGDLIKTYSNGYKEIAYIGRKKIYNPSTYHDVKDRLYRFAKSKIRELKEDLCITGRHCTLHRTISDGLREQLIENMGDVYSTENLYRVQAWMDDRAEPFNDDSTVTVWHLALENKNIYHNYGVWANGLLVETCSIVYLTKISNMELMH